jgi:hypothetical protein
MSEYKKRIAVFAVVAVLAAAGLAVAVNTLSLGGKTSSTPTLGYTASSSTVLSTSTMFTTAQNDFTFNGPAPLVVITPHNNTFTLTYRATTLSGPVALSLNLSQSWITTYTNGTEWITLSQACSTSSQQTTSSGNVTNQTSVTFTSITVVTVTGAPCGVSPAPGWVPVNGSAIKERVEPSASQVQMSVAPSSISANQTVTVQFTITLTLKPGVYAVGLALGVIMAGAYSGFEFSDLNPFPVVVK